MVDRSLVTVMVDRRTATVTGQAGGTRHQASGSATWGLSEPLPSPRMQWLARAEPGVSSAAGKL